MAEEDWASPLELNHPGAPMKETAPARVTRETKSMEVKEVYSEMCSRQQEKKIEKKIRRLKSGTIFIGNVPR